ncbi:MAG: AsmA-like C-terminal region-containing protein [Candidatus Binatia bacterium]
MRKWIVLGAILLAMAGAVALALANLNSYLNRNKDWLADQITTALGRQVSFTEIGVRLFGGFGARIKDLRIADDPGFSREDFVKAGEVQISMALWPALFGRYEVKRVALVKPEVSIIRAKQGFNYDSIGKGKSAEPPKGAPTAERPPRAAKPPGGEEGRAETAALLVSLVDIEKGELHFVDRTASPPSDLRLGALDFSASDVSVDRPIHVKLATALFGADKQNVRVEGSFGPIGNPPNVQAAPLDLSIQIGALVLDNLKKVEALSRSLPPELSSADPVSLQAKLSGSLGERLVVDAKLDGGDAAIRYGPSFQKPKGVPLKLDLRAERLAGAVDVKSLTLRLAELNLTAKGRIDDGPGGALDFQIDSDKAPLAGWDKLLPAFVGHQVSGTAEVHVRAQGKTGSKEVPQLNGTVALIGVSAKKSGSPYEIDDLNGRIELQGASARIPQTTFKLSGSAVTVRAEVASFRPLAATFDLQSPQLAATSLQIASASAKKPEVLRGVELRGQFRAADKGAPEFQGSLRSTEGSLRDFDYRDLATDVSLRDQVVNLAKLDLRAFDGNYSGGGRYDMHDKDNPRFDFRSSVRGMDVKRILESQSPGSEKRLEGRLDADLELAGAGKRWEAIKPQLRGSGRLDVKNGMLKDVNLADQVLQSVTGVGGLSSLISPRVRAKHRELFETGDTKFDKMGGSVVIADGVARTDDLTITARDYAMLGKGTYSLDNQLDFNATFVASRELSDDVVADVRETKYLTNTQGKIEIPFRLTGALPRVKAKPDSEFIVNALSRALVGKGLEKLLGKGKPLPPGVTPTPDTKHPERELLRKGLEGLFGR